uniref:Uncharacterized protein n=1 Tax=Oryza nivara TaxID=4536 RepID=A0A0E0J8M7_ORYNI
MGGDLLTAKLLVEEGASRTPWKLLNLAPTMLTSMPSLLTSSTVTGPCAAMTMRVQHAQPQSAPLRSVQPLELALQPHRGERSMPAMVELTIEEGLQNPPRR